MLYSIQEMTSDGHKSPIYQDYDPINIQKKLIELLKLAQYQTLIVLTVSDPMYLGHIPHVPHYKILKGAWDGYVNGTLGTVWTNRNMITKIIYDQHDKESQLLLNTTLLSIPEISQYLQTKDRVLSENWSKSQLQKEFKKIGYTKTVWYRKRRELQQSFLEKYYYYCLNGKN